MEDHKSAADWLQILATQKDPALADLVQAATSDDDLLRELLRGVVSKNEVYRYNCFKTLLQISDEQPAVLYPEWDTFVELLSSDNSYHRSIAVNIIAGLTAADSEDRFASLFDRYFDILDDDKIVTARYTARSAGKIAQARPELQTRIAERLLAIDETHHPQGRRDLLKADAIESLAAFFEASADKERILAFVEEQLACSSPKTRKAARAFLERQRG